VSALAIGETADFVHDVMRGPALGFIDYDDSVQWFPFWVAGDL
jgi:hypothetical protein